LHRCLAQRQRGSQLAVAQPAADQREDLPLARREHGKVSTGTTRPRGEPLDEPPGDRRREQRVAGPHQLDGGDQVLGRHVLQKEPRGPLCQGPVHVLVQVERGQHQHPDVGSGADDLPGGLEAVHHRHPDVHQHDVRPVLEHRRDGRRAVRRLARDLEARRLQDQPEPAADQRLVVGDHYAHGNSASGIVARSRHPPPGRGPASTSPPYSPIRSRSPSSPRPGWLLCPPVPRPSSLTVITSWPRRPLIRTTVGASPECRSTFVRPSCTTRYTARSSPGGSPAAGRLECSSTGRPAADTRSTSAPTSASPGCGVSGASSAPFAAGASNDSRCRSSPIAVRPLASTASSASSARPVASARGLPSTLRAAPACTIITLTLCVTTSCSSLAIRARSSSMARLVAASCSACTLRSRDVESPTRRRSSRMPSPAATVGTTTISAVYRSGMSGRFSGNVAMTAIAPASATPSASSRCALYSTALNTAKIAVANTIGGAWCGKAQAAAKIT